MLPRNKLKLYLPKINCPYELTLQTFNNLSTARPKVLCKRYKLKRVYVKRGTCPEPTGTNRNPPEPTRNLEKRANGKIKKQIKKK